MIRPWKSDIFHLFQGPLTFTSSFPGLAIVISRYLTTRDSNWHHCSPTKPTQFLYRSKAEKQAFLLASLQNRSNEQGSHNSTTKDLQPVIHEWIIAAYVPYVHTYGDVGRWSSYFAKIWLEFEFFPYLPDGIFTSFFFSRRVLLMCIGTK